MSAITLEQYEAAEREVSLRETLIGFAEAVEDDAAVALVLLHVAVTFCPYIAHRERGGS